MPSPYDRPNDANSPSHLPQQPDDPDASGQAQPSAGRQGKRAPQQQQDSGASSQRQQGDTSIGNANSQQQAGQQDQRSSQQQAHSEPLPVPGNSRVDSAPDAADDDIEPERL